MYNCFVSELIITNYNFKGMYFSTIALASRMSSFRPDRSNARMNDCTGIRPDLSLS